MGHKGSTLASRAALPKPKQSQQYCTCATNAKCKGECGPSCKCRRNSCCENPEKFYETRVAGVRKRRSPRRKIQRKNQRVCYPEEFFNNFTGTTPIIIAFMTSQADFIRLFPQLPHKCSNTRNAGTLYDYFDCQQGPPHQHQSRMSPDYGRTFKTTRLLTEEMLV